MVRYTENGAASRAIAGQWCEAVFDSEAFGVRPALTPSFSRSRQTLLKIIRPVFYFCATANRLTWSFLFVREKTKLTVLGYVLYPINYTARYQSWFVSIQTKNNLFFLNRCSVTLSLVWRHPTCTVWPPAARSHYRPIEQTVCGPTVWAQAKNHVCAFIRRYWTKLKPCY